MKPLIVKDATKPLSFRITEEHVDLARKAFEEDPSRGTDECRGQHCVVRQALVMALGDYLDRVEVGNAITKVFTGRRCLRYATPAVLRKALQHFDDTGEWDLPEGDYDLRPPGLREQLGASRIRGRRKPPKRRAGPQQRRTRAVPARRIQVTRRPKKKAA